jgi:hypothetical protein
VYEEGEMAQQVAEVEKAQYLTFTNSSPTWHSSAEGEKKEGEKCSEVPRVLQKREYRWLRPNLTHLASATPQNITIGISLSFPSTLKTKISDGQPRRQNGTNACAYKP